MPIIEYKFPHLFETEIRMIRYLERRVARFINGF